MKHRKAYHVSLATVLGFTALFALRVEAQSTPKNTSSLTWGLGFGSGSYTGSVPLEIQSGPETIGGGSPGKVSFTKVATAFRLLFATSMRDSRLSVGVEYAAQMVLDGGESEYFYTDAPDGILHTVLCIGDYVAGAISDNISIHAGGGLGVLFTTYTDSDVSPELAASVRLLAPIRVRPSFTIDPEIRVLASVGKEKASLVQFLVGMTYRW